MAIGTGRALREPIVDPDFQLCGLIKSVIGAQPGQYGRRHQPDQFNCCPQYGSIDVLDRIHGLRVHSGIHSCIDPEWQDRHALHAAALRVIGYRTV